MKIVEWVILLVISCTFMPEACQANSIEEVEVFANSPVITLHDRTTDFLCSLISLLHFTAGDLTEEVYHTTLEKKALLRTFVYLREDQRSYAEDNHLVVISRKFVPNGFGQTDYYIYTLERILI